MIDQKKVRKCEGDVLLSDFKGKRKREKALQAEIKIMRGSPHQYTATPLCHP